MKRQDKPAIAAQLNHFLADSYTLLLKTHNFHWNVTGSAFYTLHLLFEQQYQDLFTAVDDIAERIRALGERAAGSYQEFSKLTQIKEATNVVTAEQMPVQLLADHELLISRIEAILPIASEAGDETTVGLLVDRLQVHEKTAWMLRSSVG